MNKNKNKYRKTSRVKEAFEQIGEIVAIFLRNGNWQVNYQFEGRQIRRSLRTKNKKEAKRRALKVEREIMLGEHKHQMRSALIEEVVAQYLDHKRAEGRSKRTVDKYTYCLDILLELATRMRRKRISQIDIAFVDQFRAERAAGNADRKRAKPKTVHNDTVTIRQLVNFALKRGLIQQDPLKGLEIKTAKSTPQPCWTRDEVDLILATAKPPHRPALVFLAETGARVGEAKWLTWNDVDIARKQVHIRPKEEWKPKSGDQRVIPMSPRVRELLESLPRYAKWVFTAKATARYPAIGRQISERRLLEYLKRVLKRLGLSGHLHTFRHSFISFAAYEGTSERVLRKWIGHVDHNILDWYFHLADTESQAAMDRLSRAAERKQKPA